MTSYVQWEKGWVPALCDFWVWKRARRGRGKTHQGPVQMCQKGASVIFFKKILLEFPERKLSWFHSCLCYDERLKCQVRAIFCFTGNFHNSLSHTKEQYLIFMVLHLFSTVSFSLVFALYHMEVNQGAILLHVADQVEFFILLFLAIPSKWET